MATLGVREFCIININLFFIDGVLCNSLSLMSVESGSHLVSLLFITPVIEEECPLKKEISLIMAFIPNKRTQR